MVPISASCTPVRAPNPAPAAKAAGPGTPAPGARPPAEGFSLLPPDSLKAFILVKPRPTDATLTIVPVTDRAFKSAVQVETTRLPAQSWDIQIRLPIDRPVAKGDAIEAAFSMRSVKSASGEADTSLIFEQVGGAFQKSVEYPASAGANWTLFRVPFRAAADYTAGAAQLNFRFGFSPQTVEIGGISLVDFGKSLTNPLPAPVLTYPGIAPNAPWRMAAAARIDKYRKGELTVLVHDFRGRPVPGAQVQVHMLRHAFGFGSAVDENALLGSTPDDKKYQATVLKLFNKAVLENGLKWPGWEWRPGRALRAVKWLRDHHIEVRGHNLVWPSWRYLPLDVRTLRNDPAALRRRIDEHIIQEVTALRGQVSEWDVLNEPYTSHALMDILGKESMVEWFKLAHAADPRPELFVNDFSILSAGGRDTAHQDAYAGVIQYLQANGAPLGGIGLQSHFGDSLTGPDRLLQILDRFAKFGLPLEVTELDVNISDEKLQAQYLRDFMTLAFSYPAIKGIMIWGFWEGRDWIPRAALYRRDWTLKPNGQAWIDLVFHQWWTNATGATGPDGAYRVRGFLGDYEITVSIHGKKRVVRASLPQKGASVVVKI